MTEETARAARTNERGKDRGPRKQRGRIAPPAADQRIIGYSIQSAALLFSPPLHTRTILEAIRTGALTPRRATKRGPAYLLHADLEAFAAKFPAVTLDDITR